jgi:hypothetical protein
MSKNIQKENFKPQNFNGTYPAGLLKTENLYGLWDN